MYIDMLTHIIYNMFMCVCVFHATGDYDTIISYTHMGSTYQPDGQPIKLVKDFAAPIDVSNPFCGTQVRWNKGHEFGTEFLLDADSM